MATIWLAMAGEYEDAYPVAAFTTEEDAAGFELGQDVAEVQLYTEPPEVRDYHGMIWYLGRPLQTPEETPPGRVPNPYPYDNPPQRQIYDGQPERLEISKGAPNSIGYGTLWVWGWDLELVKATGDRIYQEETK